MLQVYMRGDNGTMPTRGSALAAGYDIYSAESVIIPPHTRHAVHTEISIQVPPGTYGRLAPRSGLSIRGIDLGAGVIDADYRGEVKVLLINNADSEFEVTKGHRIAQLILEKHAVVDACAMTQLDPSERGEGGFGSTGN